MNALENIKQKLEGFLRKYYVNELIKGTFLFIGIGLLYFILTVLLEYFIWFGTAGRLILFWLFITIETILFLKFIVSPLLYLFKIRKGIDYKTASSIIGNHFPEVNDKLLNVLQLSENAEKSDLLLASIEQKSGTLTPIPFQTAINYKANLKYVWYALAPIFFILIVIIIGKSNLFTESYKRVIDYKTAYTPPAPFQFFILNDSLQAIEGQSYTLKVNTAGKYIPENVQINVDGNLFFMQQKTIGTFEYEFSQPKKDIKFNLTANNVSSHQYSLEVISTPSLVSFEMLLEYPKYTGKKSEILKSTGNATIPEGTAIKWLLKTTKTDAVSLQLKDTVLNFNKNENQFELSKNIYSNLNYTISTSNKNLKNYENLGYSISVIKDQYPEIKVEEKVDSLHNEKRIYIGQISDDYGLQKLNLVYYPQGTDSINKLAIPTKNGSYDRFAYIFPENLNLNAGTTYKFYFEVIDNDAINGGKKAKSNVYGYRKLTNSELKNQQLKKQQENIQEMENSLNQIESQEKQLDKISETNKQKNQLNYNDKKKIANYLERQQQQDQMMKRYHEELQQNLEEFQKGNKEKSELNKLLQERLERQQKEMEKNEKLMEQLKEISHKINKEELSKRLEQMAKQQKKDSRNLEQLLELTKRYYTTAKAEKIKKDLEDLAKKQRDLSNETEEENSVDKQEQLNTDFENIQEEIKDLKEQNEKLEKPMELGTDTKKEEEIKATQKEATEKLEEKSTDNSEDNKSENQAKQKQQKAAKKIEELAKQMGSMMQAGSEEGMIEDMESLRQILDNLLVFSFDQEEIMKRIQNYNEQNSNLSVYLRKQNELRTLFEHVDDSLFALSLRQPKISEKINENIESIYYNIDRTLEQFAENQYYQGISHQQYTLTATNELADFLSDVLNNMQQSMASGQSGGSGKSFQLPDIIQSQEELNKQMQQGLEKGKEGQKPSEGNEGEEQNGDKKGMKKGEGLGNEKMSGEVFEIYKQQQELRNELEKQLENINGAGEKQHAKKLANEMEQIENNLLEKGFNEATQQKMLQLQHQLLKLEDATLKQGQKEERESNTNTKEFENSSTNNLPEIQQYFNEVEILNRQALPLRQNYKQKVNAYFRKDD